MKIEEINDFEKALQAYTFSFHQNIVQYLETLKQKGYTLDDVKDFVFAKRKLIEKDIEAFTKKQKLMEQECPECSGLMLLLPVNDTPGTQTGEPGDKSVWLCQNNRCMETIYNEKTMGEIIKSGGT